MCGGPHDVGKQQGLQQILVMGVRAASLGLLSAVVGWTWFDFVCYVAASTGGLGLVLTVVQAGASIHASPRTPLCLLKRPVCCSPHSLAPHHARHHMCVHGSPGGRNAGVFRVCCYTHRVSAFAFSATHTLQVYEVLAQQLEAEVPHGTKDESGADAAPPPLSALGAEQGALVWVQYMRFLRRTAGAPHARQVSNICALSGECVCPDTYIPCPNTQGGAGGGAIKCRCPRPRYEGRGGEAAVLEM